MKKLILILLFLTSLVKLGNASHLLGGGIEYQCVGNRQWKITLKVLTDCSTSSSLCTTLNCNTGVTARPNRQLNPSGAIATPNSVNATLALVSIEDVNKIEVTQLGNIAKNYCTNLGQQIAGNKSPSWEVMTFEGILDLSMSSLNNTNCAYWDIIFVSTSRGLLASNIGGGTTPFVIKSTLNIFHKSNINEGLKCNSPKINNPHLFRVSSGQQVFYNPAAIDRDGDSLSYYIGNAYNDIDEFGLPVPVSYNAPYSNVYPFALNQTAEPHISEPTTNNPYLILDNTTGTLRFNAVNNSSSSVFGSIVIGINKWSKNLLGQTILAGNIEKEFLVSVVNSSGNNSLYLKNTNSTSNSFVTYYSMLVNDTLSVAITAKDPDIGGSSSRTDTTKIISVYSSDTAFLYNHTNINSAEDAIEIKYNPGLNKLNTTQNFTIVAVDNNFPMNLVSRQFRVKVVDGTASANIVKSTDSCAIVTIAYTNPVNVKTVAWDIITTPFQYDFSTNTTLHYDNTNHIKLPAFNSAGKYLVRLTITRLEPENAPPIFIFDTITLIKKSISKAIKDTAVCYKSPIAFIVKQGSYTWKKNNQLLQNTGNMLHDTIWENTTYQISGTVMDSTYWGCVINDSAFVVVKVSPITNLKDQYGLCGKPEISLNATIQNTDSVAYLWNTQQTDSIVSVTQPGNYSVTITNLRNGCSITKNTLIDYGIPVNLTTIKQVTACNGDTVHLQANGSQQYVWRRNINGALVVVSTDSIYPFKATQSSQIFVTGYNNNQLYCDKQDTVTLNVIPRAQLTSILGNDSPFINSTIIYQTDSNPNHTLAWQVVGGQIQNTTAFSATILWTSVGQALLNVTASNANCADVSFNKVITVQPSVGINELNVFNQLRLYPNPANNVLNINFNVTSQHTYVTILNSTLQEISTHSLNPYEYSHQVSTKELKNGLYFVKIKQRDSSEIYKIIIHHNE